MNRRAAVIVQLCLALSACAVGPTPPPDGPTPQPDARGTTIGPGSSIERPRGGTSDTVLALLAEASRAERAGDLQRTEALLERALRIEPHNAVLWHYLARMRLKQGRFEQASGLAFKSSSLAHDDVRLQAENWRVVAHARRALGDGNGARAAEQKANTLTAQ
ncbi:MAG: hypothetical protein AMJ69_05655 [Gammaproteobacteria bacterium SG8_47]|nr:MAG: hypothetical protein AMJ69_05655 [Gammaproteobacteria bacterium SG8_47]